MDALQHGGHLGRCGGDRGGEGIDPTFRVVLLAGGAERVEEAQLRTGPRHAGEADVVAPDRHAHEAGVGAEGIELGWHEGVGVRLLTPGHVVGGRSRAGRIPERTEQ